MKCWRSISSRRTVRSLIPVSSAGVRVPGGTWRRELCCWTCGGPRDCRTIQGCQRQQPPDISCCSVTHLTERVRTQQLSKACGVITLTQGAAGDRKYKDSSRTGTRKRRPVLLATRPPDACTYFPVPHIPDFTKHPTASVQGHYPHTSYHHRYSSHDFKGCLNPLEHRASEKRNQEGNEKSTHLLRTESNFLPSSASLCQIFWPGMITQ